MTDLLTRIQAHNRMMAPHHCEREAGKLLIEAAEVLANADECLESNKAVESALEGVAYAVFAVIVATATILGAAMKSSPKN